MGLTCDKFGNTTSLAEKNVGVICYLLFCSDLIFWKALRGSMMMEPGTDINLMLGLEMVTPHKKGLSLLSLLVLLALVALVALVVLVALG